MADVYTVSLDLTVGIVKFRYSLRNVHLINESSKLAQERYFENSNFAAFWLVEKFDKNSLFSNYSSFLEKEYLISWSQFLNK